MRNRMTQDDEPVQPVAKRSSFKQHIMLVGGFFVALFLLTIALGSWYTVNTGDVGVVYRNASLHSLATEGLSFKMPIVDNVKHVRFNTQRHTYANVVSYTSDRQTTTSKLTFIWKLDQRKIEQLIRENGSDYADRLIDPLVPTYFKSVINGMDAFTIIASREKIGAQVLAHVSEILAPKGIIAEDVKLENLDFTKEYEKSIEEASKAQAHVIKAEQELAKARVDAQKVVVAAKAEADSAIEKARGEAQSIELRATAEANAVEKIGTALSKNPTLIEKIKAERWDGKLPTSMIPGSAVPFISIK